MYALLKDFTLALEKVMCITRKGEKRRKGAAWAAFYIFYFLTTVISPLLSDYKAFQREDDRKRQAALL